MTPRRKITYPYNYDLKKRRLAKTYSRNSFIMGEINAIAVPLIFLIVFVAAGCHLRLAEWVSSFGIFQAPAFVFALFILFAAVRFPLGFYSGYIYEHKYKLSAYTLQGWFRDYFKALVLGLVISTVLISALYVFLMPLALWWLYAGVAYFGLIVFFNYIFPIVIFPIFYKSQPYTDKKMIQKLKAMAARYGVKVKKILVAKESEKSHKANAFFAGIGNTKRIVLFDTLLNKFAPAEIETVVAHELGHQVNKDVPRFIVLDAIKIFPVLFLVDVLLRATLPGVGVSSLSAIASLPLLLIFYSVIEIVIMPLVNTHSRHREARADYFALESARNPGAQISAEKRLTDIWLAQVQPHPLIETIFETHPSASKRIKMCEEWKHDGRK